MNNNTETPFASVEVEGKTYKLAYDFNAIAEVEIESGCNLLSGLLNLANLNAMQLAGLLCAGMRAADPKSKITIRQVTALLKYESIYPFTEALAQSILLSIPKPEVAVDPAGNEE